MYDSTGLSAWASIDEEVIEYAADARYRYADRPVLQPSQPFVAALHSDTFAWFAERRREDGSRTSRPACCVLPPPDSVYGKRDWAGSTLRHVSDAASLHRRAAFFWAATASDGRTNRLRLSASAQVSARSLGSSSRAAPKTAPAELSHRPRIARPGWVGAEKA